MFGRGNKNSFQPTKQVVVLGAGFGGVRAALDLAKNLPDSRIILVSRDDYHFYHPTYYEVASTMRGEVPAFKLRGTTGFPISEITGRYKNIIFKQAWVENVDTDRKLVRTDGGDLAYDFLVIALGSQTDYFGIEGLENNSLGLKTFSEAIVLRNRLALALDEYKQTGDQAYLNFVIGGGGFTGVEFAAELVNYIKHLKKQYKNPPSPKVWLLEGAPQLVPGVSPLAGKKILGRMKMLGVEVVLDTFITKVTPSSVISSTGIEVPSRTVIWTGGVKAVSVPFLKNMARDKKGRTIVSSRLNLDFYPDVFIIGDCACYMDPAKNAPLPPTAQVAIHQARYVARAIKFKLTNQEVPVYRPIKDHNYLLPLSGKYACFITKNHVYTGFWPYVLRRIADLKYFLSVITFFRAVNYWLKGSMLYLKND